MANNTNETSVIAKIPSGVWVSLIALNIFSSIFATLGNVLILVALQKVSSIHPPTRLLFRCLAVTDLCVGLLGQPLYVYVNYIGLHFDIGKFMVELQGVLDFVLVSLFAVSPLTSAAISVDRLLALLLGLRYRHVVTLCRVRVVIACVWFITVSNASLYCGALLLSHDKLLFASWWMFLRSFNNDFYNNLNIFVHEDFFHPPSSTSPSARSCSTRTVKQSKKCTEHSTIQEDSV